MWFEWLELASVNCLSGPKCASIGLAQEALVGVKHSLTLFFRAHCRIVLPSCAERLSMIT
ncbi:hypothetical protein RKD27_009317 [Streptomyces sp. SAI-126]